MIVNDLVEIKVFSTIFGQQVITTFPYRVKTSSANPDDAVLLQRCAAYFISGVLTPGTAFVAACPQNMNVDIVQAQLVKPVRTRAEPYTYNQPGQDPNDAVTANSAASIERAGAYAGRSWTGRISIPALAPQNMVDGLVTAGFLAKMQTIADRMKLTWYNILIDTNLELLPCIINRKKFEVAPKWRIVGSADVVYTNAKRTVRTQRSRNIGKGI